MKISIFFFMLLELFDGSIIRLGYHKCTDAIYSTSGLVALEIDKFDTDEDIYVTYTGYNGKIVRNIKYTFMTEFPYDEGMYLPFTNSPYSDGTTSHKHNVSDGHGGYTVYYTYDYHYYYEFKKKANATFLVMSYDTRGYSPRYIKIDNTYFGRYLTIIIIVSVVVGVILIGVGIFLCRKYRDSFECPSSCPCSCSCPCPWKRSYSYNIASTSSNTTTSPQKENLLNIVSDNSSSNSASKNLEMKEPVPEPKEDYGEKPYYLENNQPPSNDYNSAQPQDYPPVNNNYYAQPNYDQGNQPMNAYDQPGAGYNQYDQNPPLNNEGYNYGNFTGGGGVY